MFKFRLFHEPGLCCLFRQMNLTFSQSSGFDETMTQSCEVFGLDVSITQSSEFEEHLTPSSNPRATPFKPSTTHWRSPTQRPSTQLTSPSQRSTEPSLITTPSFAMPRLPSPTPTLKSMGSALPLPPSELNLGLSQLPSTSSSQQFQGFSTGQSELGAIAQRLQTPLQQRMTSASTSLTPEQRTRAMRNRALAIRKRRASQESSQESTQVRY